MPAIKDMANTAIAGKARSYRGIHAMPAMDLPMT